MDGAGLSGPAGGGGPGADVPGGGSGASGGLPALAGRVVDAWLATHPETATAAGRRDHDGRLADLSRDGTAREVAAWVEAIDALDAVDLDDLPTGEQVDLEVLRARLDARLLDLQVRRVHDRDPAAALPGRALWPLLSRDTRPVADRLEALASRLDAVPDALAASRARLDDVPRVAAETAVAQTRGALDLVVDDVPRLLAQEPSLAGMVEPAVRRAAAALARHATWLAEDLVPRADGDPRLGPELHAAVLWHALDAPVAPDALAAAARDEMAESREALVAVCRDLEAGRRPPGDDDDALVRRVLDRLADEGACDDETFVPAAAAALSDVTARVREADLVTVPDDPVAVVEMPAFARGVASAYCEAPGPFEPRGAVTHYAVSPPPREWPSDRRRSFFREYSRSALVDLALHEGVPGHALQLAHARRLRASTPVRALLASGTFVEGWAVEVERLCVDPAEGLGLGGPAVRATQLKLRLRVAANALLDVGVHSWGWVEQQARDLLEREAFQEPGEAAGKWRRALLTAGQLSTYFVGQAQVRALRRDLGAARPGATERARADALLAHGSPPPRHLRALLDLPPEPPRLP